LLGNGSALSLQKSTNYYFLSTYSISTKPIVETLLARYRIERKGTRNGVLMQLIGDLIHMFGREAADRIVREHFARYQQNIGTPLDEHMLAFAKAWEMMRTKIVDSLPRTQRSCFDALGSDHQREGFLIVRAFAGAATHKGGKNFEISQSSLADRLSVTPPGAANVIQKLCDLEAIERTQRAVRHKSAGRFCWLL
jgi:hypothetical protein